MRRCSSTCDGCSHARDWMSNDMSVQRALGQRDALREPVSELNDLRALHGYSVVDGGDIVGIMQRGGEMMRIPAWTVIRVISSWEPIPPTRCHRTSR